MAPEATDQTTPLKYGDEVPAGGGPCCWLDLCCPPGGAKQAAELAAHLGIPEEAAAAVLKEFRLVPRAVEPSLHKLLDAELRGYLHAKAEAPE